MAAIYDTKSEPLFKLLKKAANDNGATLLIPNLQRPFIWTPNQTVLLIDSLIRGWPFGTLLLWETHNDDIIKIPSRPFWKMVDRTDENKSEQLSTQNLPGEFQMVLDGQQRIQSMILALYGDNYGFKLYDRDWADELNDKRSRGRKPKYWSIGNLCFDIDLFSEEYNRSKDLLDVDYTKVFKWVINNMINGYYKKTNNLEYKGPLNTINITKYIRFSRLWELAGEDENVKEEIFRKKINQYFCQNKINHPDLESIIYPLGELMTTLVQVKTTKIHYLEVKRQNKDVWNDEEYTESVVNIFTRLNTAGRTLSKEEITFAWLKVNWVGANTGNKTAVECIDELINKLKDNYSLDLSYDEIINLLSLIWSIVFNNGRILSSKDLLKSKVIEPMAKNLSNDWKIIFDSILSISGMLFERQMLHKEQYLSLNSVGLIWGIKYITEKWIKGKQLKITESDGFRKGVDKLIANNIDRWIFCSQWAGIWAGSSGSTMEKYVSDLYQDFRKIETEEHLENVISVLNTRLLNWINDLKQESIESIDNLRIVKRERVSDYYIILWLWHRLDKLRWENSKIQLRNSLKTKPKLEVDHIISYKSWENKVEDWKKQLRSDEIIDKLDEIDEKMVMINQIGNCFLLEKTFNISKGTKQLKNFIDEIYEFENGVVKLDEWRELLKIEAEHINSDETSIDELIKKMQTRTENIKIEIKRFINGEQVRCDI